MGILHSRDESTKEAAPKKVRRTYDADSTVKRSAAAPWRIIMPWTPRCWDGATTGW